MVEGQKKRQIGKGMKTRGTKRVKSQSETNEMTAQSTNEGQHTPVPEAVLEPQEGNETPGNLELEKGENSLQNLESSEAIVAHDGGLEAALKESGDVIDAKFEEVPDLPPTPAAELAHVGGPQIDLEAAMAVGTGAVKDLKRPTIAE